MNKAILMALVLTTGLMSCSPKIGESTASSTSSSNYMVNSTAGSANAASANSGETQATLTTEVKMDNVVPAAAKAPEMN